MKIPSRLALAGVCLLLSACSVTRTPPVQITHTQVPSLKTSASFDVIDIDQNAHRLYAADRQDGGLDVFDVSTPTAQYVKTVAMPSSPNGLAIASDLHRVFVGLSDGSVAFVDTVSDEVIAQVPTGGKLVDLIDYSAETHSVYASNSTEGKIAVIDVQTATRSTVLDIGRFTLEQPRYDPVDHFLYVTSPDADAIFQVDPNSGAITHKLLLGGCRGRGMAIDPTHSQAVVACGSWAIRMNLHHPTDATGFTQVPGGDVVTYDRKVDRFFVASPTAKPSQVAVLGGNPIDYIAAVSPGGFGNSAAYDETNDMIYAPDARQGSAGVVGFKMPTGQIGLGDVPPAAFGGVAVLILGTIVIVSMLARHSDPVHRRASEPMRRPDTPKQEQAEGEVRAGAKRWSRKVEPPA